MSNLHQEFVDSSLNVREIEVDDSWRRDLYSDPAYAQYRTDWDLASNHFKLFDDPLFVEVETSYACNYKCPFCPQVTLPEKPTGGLMKADLLDKLFQEFADRRIPSVNLAHGGEPLIRKDIPQLLARLREVGVLDRMLHTNAYLLSETLSEAILEAGVTKMNFSLDAITEPTYDLVRIGGNFDRVYKNVHKFLELKKKRGLSYPRTRVSFVVTETNKHEQKAFFDYWKDKVNVIAYQQEYDFSANGNKLRLERQDRPKGLKPCSLLWQHLCVTHAGHITCMHDYQHDNLLGNVKTHTLHDCWNSAEMNRFRDLHKQDRACDVAMCEKCLLRVSPVS